MFLARFSYNVDDTQSLADQVLLVINAGMDAALKYIHFGWNELYTERNMSILCAILEIKQILAKNKQRQQGTV